MQNKEISLYIHIPFCLSKCNYCNFFSTSLINKASYESIKPYFLALSKEIRSYKKTIQDYTVSTIYIGGGTPSSVNPEHIEDVLKIIKDNFLLKSDCEVTIEVNPCSIQNEKAEIYKNAGVNRISIGMQSNNDEILYKIGRQHTFEDFQYAVWKIGHHFNSLNIDIMLGLPNQTIKDIKALISYLKLINPNHISCYDLILEEGTPLYNNKTLKYPTEAQIIKMREFLEKRLKKLGIHKYEVSNYAKKGFESKHNLNYWNNGEFIGFGAGAYSSFDGYEFENVANIEEYIEAVEYKLPIEKHKLTEEERYVNYILLGLRTAYGIELDKIKPEKYEIINNFIEQKLLQKKGSKVFATDKGFLILNKIILELV